MPPFAASPNDPGGWRTCHDPRAREAKLGSQESGTSPDPDNTPIGTRLSVRAKPESRQNPTSQDRVGRAQTTRYDS
jgi:hypothetical protein